MQTAGVPDPHAADTWEHNSETKINNLKCPKPHLVKLLI